MRLHRSRDLRGNCCRESASAVAHQIKEDPLQAVPAGSLQQLVPELVLTSEMLQQIMRDRELAQPRDELLGEQVRAACSTMSAGHSTRSDRRAAARRRQRAPGCPACSGWSSAGSRDGHRRRTAGQDAIEAGSRASTRDSSDRHGADDRHPPAGGPERLLDPFQMPPWAPGCRGHRRNECDEAAARQTGRRRLSAK